MQGPLTPGDSVFQDCQGLNTKLDPVQNRHCETEGLYGTCLSYPQHPYLCRGPLAEWPLSRALKASVVCHPRSPWEWPFSDSGGKGTSFESKTKQTGFLLTQQMSGISPTRGRGPLTGGNKVSLSPLLRRFAGQGHGHSWEASAGFGGLGHPDLGRGEERFSQQCTEPGRLVSGPRFTGAIWGRGRPRP